MSDPTGQVLDEVFLSLLPLIPPRKDSGFSPINEKRKINSKSCLK
jgi:hypothetical protein